MGTLYFAIESATTLIPDGPDVQTYGQPTDDFFKSSGLQAAITFR